MSDLVALHATWLHLLHDEQGQSPWLDDLTRGYLTSGELSRWVASGIRGVTSNPTTFQRAIAGSSDYDGQFSALTRAGHSVNDAYWEMVIDDVTAALRVLRPVHDASGGADGFVSVEVAPDLAHDTTGTIAAARALHDGTPSRTCSSRCRPPPRASRRSGSWCPRVAASMSPWCSGSRAPRR